MLAVMGLGAFPPIMENGFTEGGSLGVERAEATPQQIVDKGNAEGFTWTASEEGIVSVTAACSQHGGLAELKVNGVLIQQMSTWGELSFTAPVKKGDVVEYIFHSSDTGAYTPTRAYFTPSNS